jgi:hypothetical protein
MRKKSAKGTNKNRSPSGMTTKTAKAKQCWDDNQNSKGKSNARMTNKTAKAKAMRGLTA